MWSAGTQFRMRTCVPLCVALFLSMATQVESVAPTIGNIVPGKNSVAFEVTQTNGANAQIKCVTRTPQGGAAPSVADVWADPNAVLDAAVVSGTATAFTIGVLVASTPYDIFCADNTNNEISAAAPFTTLDAFNPNTPAVTAVADTTATVTITTTNAATVRCIVQQPGATPTAAEVYNTQDSTQSIRQSLNAAATGTFSFSGLTQGTSYSTVCSDGTVKSNALDFTTQGFKSNLAPTIVAGSTVKADSFQVSTKTTFDTNVRCVAQPNSIVTAPSAANIQAGQYGNGNAANLGSAPPAKACTTNVACDIDQFTAMDSGVIYNIYCATATNNYLQQPLQVTTQGFISQPSLDATQIGGTASNSNPTTDALGAVFLEVSYSMSNADTACSCVAYQGAGVAQTSASTVFNASPLAAPNDGDPAFKVGPIAVVANQVTKMQFTGMKAKTAYSIYCATDPTGALSTMLQVRTPGFVIDPPTIVGAGGTATEVTVQTELYRTESTNCAAVISGGAAPSAAQVYSGVGGGIVSFTNPVVRSENSIYNVNIQGLVSGTGYDIYCATESDTISTPIAVNTRGFTVQPTYSIGSQSTLPGTSSTTFQVTGTLNANDYVRCMAVTLNSPATAADIYSNGNQNQIGTNQGILSVTKGVSWFYTITVPATTIDTFDVLCATMAPDGALSTRLVHQLTVFLVDPPGYVSGTLTSTGFSVSTALNKQIKTVCYPYITINGLDPAAADVWAGTNSALAAGSVAPKSVTATNNLSFLFTGLDPTNPSYTVYCATDNGSTGVSEAIRSKGLLREIGGFPSASQPTVTASYAGGFDVRAMANVPEQVICSVYNVAQQSPTGQQVFQGTGADFVQSQGPFGGQANVPISFEFKGLRQNNQYAVYCATSGFSRSDRVLANTMGFSQNPTIVANSLTSTGYSVTVRLSSSELVRCLASTSAVAPPAVDIYNGVPGQGKVPDRQQSTANGLLTFTMSSLPQSQTYYTYCATQSLAVSDQLKVVLVGFTKQPVVNPNNADGIKVGGVDIVAAISSNDPIRCNAYTPGTSTTATGIFDGTAPVEVTGDKKSLGPNVDVPYSFVGLQSGMQYKIVCATATLMSDPLLITTGTFTSGPDDIVASTTATGYEVQVAVSTKEYVRCAVDTAGSTPTAYEIYNNIGMIAAPVAQLSTPNTLMTFKFSNLNPITSYVTWCASESLARSGSLDKTLIGFISAPVLVPGSITGTSYSVTTKVNGVTQVRCAAFKTGSTPTGAEIFAGSNALGSVPSLQTSTPNTDMFFRMSNLDASTAVTTFCATAGEIPSNPLPVQLAGFLQNPTVIGDPTNTAFKVQTTIDSTEKTRCVSYLSASNMNPTGQQVFQGQASVSSPAPVDATPGNPVQFEMTGLQAGAAYDVYCATASYARSNVTKVTTEGFVGPPTLINNMNSAPFGVAIVVTTATNVRCVAVPPGDQPDGRQVYEGRQSDNSMAPSHPPLQRSQSMVPANFTMDGTSADTSYDVYCATSSYTRSDKLSVTTSGGFITAPNITDFRAPVKGDITISLSGTTIRCVVVVPGNNPTAAQIYAGLDSSGKAAIYATTPAPASPNVPLRFTLYNVVQGRKYDTVCATNTGIKSSTTQFTVNGKTCNQLISCSECRDNACAFNVDTLGSQNGLCTDSCTSLYCNQCNACSYGPWSSWSTCDQPCSGGYRVRRRSPVTGQDCPAKDMQESETCNLQACNPPTIDNILGRSYSMNSRQQIVQLSGISDGGDGDQDIFVTATSSNPSIVSMPTVIYTTPSASGQLQLNLVSGEYGRSFITVTVTDSGSANSGPHSVITDFQVEVQPNPINCETEWGAWSECSTSCSGGTRQRTAYPTVLPQYGGSPCQDPPMTESESCNTNACECVITWGEWSPCDKTCGNGSQKRYERVVFDAGYCPTLKTETRECFNNPCKQDCEYTYTEWTQCSAPCNGGQRKRYAMIEAYPTSGGKPCADPLPYQLETCNTKQCGMHSPMSCSGFCNKMAPGGCGCDQQCFFLNDCCPDYNMQCGQEITNTCKDRCGKFDPRYCSCDEQCTRVGDCCPDYIAECAGKGNSCKGACGGEGQPGPNSTVASECWCDDRCLQNGDCCYDYEKTCVWKPDTCNGRCGQYVDVNDKGDVVMTTHNRYEVDGITAPIPRGQERAPQRGGALPPPPPMKNPNPFAGWQNNPNQFNPPPSIGFNPYGSPSGFGGSWNAFSRSYTDKGIAVPTIASLYNKGFGVSREEVVGEIDGEGDLPVVDAIISKSQETDNSSAAATRNVGEGRGRGNRSRGSVSSSDINGNGRRLLQRTSRPQTGTGASATFSTTRWCQCDNNCPTFNDCCTDYYMCSNQGGPQQGSRPPNQPGYLTWNVPGRR